ncbi:DUF6056 family protein [Spirosoma spitsbergense]|uniref:DUF6056 family protein n=1 Tax=Spirosoma spitsbergense TaxID=431554 RepID=UPI00036C34E7|nr:DUF6056 family protein [Spirosoma spitsbergense]
MKESFTGRIANATAVFLFLLACIPLLCLSLYNHPSAADDYCFADTAVRYGFWAAQNYYYTGWTGRYFSNMLVHANPLVWGWYDGFRLIPVLAVTALVSALFTLISELLRGESLKTRLLTTGILFFLIVLALQSVVEAFFWTAAIATYTVPTVLTIYLLAVMLRWYRKPAGPDKWLTVVWAGFLVFASIGSGETNLILLLLLLLAIAGYRLLFQRTIDPFLVFLVVVALASSWLLFRAPGNAIRMGGNAHSGELVKSMGSSFGWLAKSVGGWLVKTPILPLSLLYWPMARRITQPGAPNAHLFALPAPLLTIVYVGLLAATIFPSYYGIGLPPFARTMNVLFVFFTLGWFFVLTVWAGRNRSTGTDSGAPAFSANRNRPATTLLLVITALWLAGSIAYSTSLKQLYTDLLGGGATVYNREMNERHRLLQLPGDTLRLAPISVYPPSLFVEDLKPERTHWWNRCQSGYYNHKVIILDSTVTRTATSSATVSSVGFPAKR